MSGQNARSKTKLRQVSHVQPHLRVGPGDGARGLRRGPRALVLPTGVKRIKALCIFSSQTGRPLPRETSSQTRRQVQGRRARLEPRRGSPRVGRERKTESEIERLMRDPGPSVTASRVVGTARGHTFENKKALRDPVSQSFVARVAPKTKATGGPDVGISMAKQGDLIADAIAAAKGADRKDPWLFPHFPRFRVPSKEEESYLLL